MEPVDQRNEPLRPPAGSSTAPRESRRPRACASASPRAARRRSVSHDGGPARNLWTPSRTLHSAAPGPVVQSGVEVPATACTRAHQGRLTAVQSIVRLSCSFAGARVKPARTAADSPAFGVQATVSTTVWNACQADDPQQPASDRVTISHKRTLGGMGGRPCSPAWVLRRFATLLWSGLVSPRRQQAFDKDILVRIVPVQAIAGMPDAAVSPLIRGRVHQAREPGQGHPERSAIVRFDPHRVAVESEPVCPDRNAHPALFRSPVDVGQPAFPAPGAAFGRIPHRERPSPADTTRTLSRRRCVPRAREPASAVLLDV